MLSVASLLNPVKPEPRATGTRLPSSPSLSFYSSSSTPQPSTTSPGKKIKMSKDRAVFIKGKIKGDVNYPPFEDLDEKTRREVQKFKVFPLGKIEEYPRYIPYNSEKKNFLEKTGREGFEAFQYTFEVSGDDKVYTVIWDYNIGLVRITPFFKCCKYSKTIPAKMLNMNTGLKDITHSITGGALVAQGYWMPYSCALLVCATFCYQIAPALIPIFGPGFPSMCVPLHDPEYGRMLIDSSVILSATADTEAYRMQYQYQTQNRTMNSSQVQQRYMQNMNTTPPSLSRNLHLKHAFAGESPYTDTDISSDGGGGYFNSPNTRNSSVSPLSQPHDWLPSSRNHFHDNILSHITKASIPITHPPLQYQTLRADPFLTAIPRSIGMDMPSLSAIAHPISMSMDMAMLPGVWRGNAKRRFEELDAEYEHDVEYDAGEENNASVADEMMSVDGGRSVNVRVSDVEAKGAGETERRAAWLLMKLSVEDAKLATGHGCDRKCMNMAVQDDSRPTKKRRAASL